MICEDQLVINKFVKEASKYTKLGEVADYIPALKTADPDTLSFAVFGETSSCLCAGDSNETFTLQSISKVITLALALMDNGVEKVFSKVGMEPTGDPFNSMIKLETHSPSKPLNPMINAGALAVSSMIKGENVDEKLSRLLRFVQDLAEDSTITFNDMVAQSEFDTANLNRSLCYFMKQHGVIDDDVNTLLEFYTKQCAIEVSCSQLAKIGFIIANEGKKLNSNEQLIPTHISKILKTFMVTCGMYNASGEFAIRVGIPAKSGVSGGIMVSVPNRIGIGIYGPALDERGNSIAGMHLLEALSNHYNLSIF
ncbi:glutaminase A [Evansella sp. AB-P1]|uniref:glutaminase A n=1 Tax=Evansella sp. AB-P1 TaxID=3037653 RepID=UPI00241F2A9B|nr:glutaminase A [Evansella sp. AB-P1]MDG5789462.1 glutaminase A [Evansella sp. AB-P1]